MKQNVELSINEKYLIIEIIEGEERACFCVDIDEADLKRFKNKYILGKTRLGHKIKGIRREIPGNAAVQPGTVAGG